MESALNRSNITIKIYHMWIPQPRSHAQLTCQRMPKKPDGIPTEFGLLGMFS